MKKHKFNVKVIKMSILITSLFFLFNSLTFAAVPHLFNYQGRLTDKSGKPLEGSYSLTFRIYDHETAGNLLWEEAHQGVVIQKGVFSVLLGSVNNLNLAFDTQYYLEIKVGTEVMSPRQLIAGSAYAIKAETAEQSKNSDTVGNVGVSSTPQPNKILPLDNNAKVPLSALGLKVYDSGWFAVSQGNAYLKIHNLGTTKVLYSVYFSTASDGSFNVYGNGWGPGYWNGVSKGLVLKDLTTTTVKIQTSRDDTLGWTMAEDGSTTQHTSGYARIIMLGLE
jgi:hypothetical protein